MSANPQTLESPLQEAVRVALVSKVKSGHAQEVLDKVRAERVRLTEVARVARDRSLDARLPAAEVAAARAAADDSAFQHERLGRSEEQLTARIEALQRAEREAAWKEERAAAIQERDALLRRWARWPELEREMVELLRDTAANDARLGRDSSDPSAEVLARGCPANLYWPNAAGGGPVHRLVDIKIPNFRGHGFAWPPKGRFD